MARVMVVEDENIVAQDISETLELIGHEVPAVAATGEDACDKALRLRPDLILMDIRLRGAMDGIAAAAKIREQLDIPIIFLTAFADADNVARATATEPFGYILKPFNEKELRSTIEVALYRHAIERRLRDSERWFSTTLRSLADGVIATDENHRVNFMNSVAEALTGWTQAEAAGLDVRDVFRLVREDDGTSADWAGGEPAGESTSRRVVQAPLLLVSRSGAKVPTDAHSASIVGADGKLLGTVLVFRDVSDTRKLVRLLTAQAALGQNALRNARFDEMLGEAVVQTALALEADFCALFELLPDHSGQCLRWGVGWAAGLVGHAHIPNDAGSLACFAVSAERPVIIEDLATDGRFSAAPLLREHGVQSGVSVAIATDYGPFGVLGVYSRQRRRFARDEVSFLEATASTLGLVVERERGEMQLIRSNRALRALSSCNEALIRASDESALFDQICKTIVDVAEYRFCWVGRKEHDAAKSVTPIAHAGYEDGYLATVNITWADTPRGNGPTGTCVQTGVCQITTNTATEERFAPWRTDAAKRGYGSLIAIPLFVDRELFGALTIYAQEAGAFGSEQVRLLSELAADLGYGIASLRTRAELRRLNAELEQRVSVRTRDLQAANQQKDELLLREQQITQELQRARERENEVASRIQQMLLLDKPPRDIDGLLLAALTLPSRWIAGDFYQFFSHDRQRIDLIVADVMGKGVPAALLAAATKTYLLDALCHLMALATGGRLPEPQEIIKLAHTHMVRQLLDLESFVTLCYVRFDLRIASLDMVDCGHTGALHWRAAARDCLVLHGDNLPLGIREDATFSKLSVPFEGDDVFVFYSDGITEARDASGEQFGVARLIECVRSHVDLGPETLVAAIRNATLAFSQPAALADDLTCVAMKIVAVPALAHYDLDIPSDLRQLHRAREFVRDACRDPSCEALDQPACFALELAVNEAVSNIIKHAHHGLTDQRIQLEADVFMTYVSVRLHYSGDAFDPSRAPPPTWDGSRENGFGLYLIMHSVDNAAYYRDERGQNCIALRKSRR